MNLNAFWKNLSKQDKDTFVFVAVFALVILGLVSARATPTYFVLTGAGFIILYILMRVALVRVQLAEREHEMKRFPARKARQVLDANATKSEIQNLDKIAQSAKTKRK